MKKDKDKQILEQLSELIAEMIDEQLEEQNAIALGGVPGVSASPLFANPQRKNSTRKKELKEYNAIQAMVSDGIGESITNYVAEDDQENLGDRKKKSKKVKKSSPASQIMWAGEAKPGTLPKTKFIALEESSKKARVVRITCEKRPSSKYLKALTAFIRFCDDKLQLKNIPHIHLHVTKKPYMTTGSYVMETNTIHVLIKNRLLVDVLRTLSHELTHRKQHENGMLERELSKQDPMDEMGDLNTSYENEAYEKSGNFVKEFARIYREMPKDELFSLHEARINEAQTLIHNSHAEIKNLKSIPASKQKVHIKPKGFWYSVGDEWHNWMRAEMPEWEGKYNYRVVVDYTNILQITNKKELLRFTEEFGKELAPNIGEKWIDWQKVAAKYKGIEISPYIHSARYDVGWYYGWDVASGCIWNVTAIKKLIPVDKASNNDQ